MIVLGQIIRRRSISNGASNGTLDGTAKLFDVIVCLMLFDSLLGFSGRIKRVFIARVISIVELNMRANWE